MTNPVFDDEAEKPLDPAAERLQRKLRRLLLVSGLIMMLGVLAVFSVIIYRVVKVDGTPQWDIEANIEALIDDPLTDEIVGTSLDGTRMAITMKTGSGLKVIIVDVNSLTVLRKLTLVGNRD